MSKAKTIRIEIDKPGEGSEAHEFDCCPLKERGDYCRLYGKICNYGLTEIDIPAFCSLHCGEIVIKLRAI
ncbi:MAG: hypothetical protein V3S49_04955 [Thermodesulfobacteriota bacterium]